MSTNCKTKHSVSFMVDGIDVFTKEVPLFDVSIVTELSGWATIDPPTIDPPTIDPPTIDPPTIDPRQCNLIQ